MKTNFYNLSINEISDLLSVPRYKATQIFQWVYQKKIIQSEFMTNLPKDLRTKITEVFDFNLPEVQSHKISRDGTQKFLIEVAPGKNIECVIIPSLKRNTLCVSSEVGCNMACTFCYTGKQKLEKRLNAGQIVTQILIANQFLLNSQITNIVFMGMGEPLDNPSEVFKAIEILTNDFGINLSKKKITVSTSGIVPEMTKVSDNGVRLAVSLNATTNSLRDDIMPINRKYPLEQLIDACREFTKKTRDRVTFEYVLLSGINDFPEDIKRLHKLLSQIPSKINLIPFNEHEGSQYKKPKADHVLNFQNQLINLGHTVFIRKTMGDDVYAACGQLRTKFDKEKRNENTITI